MSERTTQGGDKDLPAVEMYAKRLEGAADVKRWRLEQRGRAAVAALRMKGFDALFVATRRDACEEVLRRIAAGASVGVGGSITVRELGVLERLAETGHTLYDHWQPGLSQEEILAIRRAQLTCDVFLSSVNALTLAGQLVSTDGIGNRIAAMTFGPKQVILAVGANKIVRDLEAAFARIREKAAPLALKETGAPLPCVQRGMCGDCHSEERLCRATLVLECRPLCTETAALVIGEALGF